ncbi:hypothetical protein [Novosphingobium kaempferiae]|uniref:hypothetical protein n=1 Tax=Novosphingobium kaempferiae TaxID=2896849 RepID=UPI001E45A686|nr:hypothetical protein [Novosphingobium kaempferiae]
MRGYLSFLLSLVASFAMQAFAPSSAKATDCYEATVMAPSPFMGNHDEVIKLDDGSLWQVQNEYEYLYEYQPEVVICPSRGVLVIEGKSLDVVALQASRPLGAHITPSKPSAVVTVVYRPEGCDYFVADGPRGYYLLEWYRGHDPAEGETLVGYDRGYGFKDVVYPDNGQTGRIYAEDYLLSRDSVIEKLAEKCR